MTKRKSSPRMKYFCNICNTPTNNTSFICNTCTAVGYHISRIWDNPSALDHFGRVLASRYQSILTAERTAAKNSLSALKGEK